MIINIKTELKTISGDVYSDKTGKPLLFKEVLINCCEMYRPDAGVTGKIIKVYALGTKTFQGKDKVEYTDEEVELIKEVCETNPMYVTGVLGAMLALATNSETK